MYPSQFTHVPVESVEEALDALQEYDDSELIAGGQSLVPLQKTRFASPEYLIDISGLDNLRYVEDTGNSVEVGALARHTDIERADPIVESVYLFSECIGQIADWPVRNQGSFGGTIAEADPSGDYLPVLQVLNPDITVQGLDGERTIPFNEFYIGMFTVDLEEGELITSASLPKLTPSVEDGGIGSTYKKHAERSGDYALVGVAAIVEVDGDDVITNARLSIGSVGPLTQATEAEKTVEGTTLESDVLDQAEAAVRDAVLPDEGGSEGEYKEAMAGEFAGRAIKTAYERALDN